MVRKGSRVQIPATAPCIYMNFNRQPKLISPAEQLDQIARSNRFARLVSHVGKYGLYCSSVFIGSGIMLHEPKGSIVGGVIGAGSIIALAYKHDVQRENDREAIEASTLAALDWDVNPDDITG